MADPIQRAQFIAGLVDIIKATENADPNPGFVTVTQLQTDALTRIKNGKGQIGMVIQGMLNGKQGQIAAAMNAMELFSAASEALRIFAHGQPITTHADFYLFQR